MASSRRDALRQLSALFAAPLVDWTSLLSHADDPLGGTIAAYQAGRATGSWSATEVTRQALERARAWNATLHARVGCSTATRCAPRPTGWCAGVRESDLRHEGASDHGLES
jgi:hypothetical protein